MRLHLGLATLLLGTLAFALVSTPAEACGRRGQRRASAPVYYSAPAYSQPMNYSPAYSQPMYGQPYGQPMYGPSMSYPPQPQRMPAVPAPSVTIAVINDRFDPVSVTVAPGTTVKWVNMGKNKHTITADKGEWDSGDLAPDTSYTATFTTAGTFTYSCRYHKDMKGTIVVAVPSGK